MQLGKLSAALKSECHHHCTTLSLHARYTNATSFSQFSQDAKEEYLRTEVAQGADVQHEESSGPRNRPPLREFVTIQEQRSITDVEKHSSSKHRQSFMAYNPRPSLAELLEESLAEASVRNKQQRHATTIDDSQDITDYISGSNESNISEDSLLSSLASINNDFSTTRSTPPPSSQFNLTYNSACASDANADADSEPYYDPDPQDFFAPPIAPLNPASNRYYAGTNAGSDSARAPYPLLGSGVPLQPPQHPRVWAVKNEIEYGRKNGWGARLWKGRRSLLCMEVKA